MKQITLTILKEDILLDNYLNSDNCPITKALHRAGYLQLKDVGRLEGYDNNDEHIILESNSYSRTYNESYKQLLVKLFNMYASFKSNVKVEWKISPIPVETFTHIIEY